MVDGLLVQISNRNLGAKSIKTEFVSIAQLPQTSINLTINHQLIEDLKSSGFIKFANDFTDSRVRVAGIKIQGA